jgi:hypothetical protein
MSATGRPEREYRSARREGFLRARRAAPSAELAYEPKRTARRSPMSATVIA